MPEEEKKQGGVFVNGKRVDPAQMGGGELPEQRLLRRWVAMQSNIQSMINTNPDTASSIDEALQVIPALRAEISSLKAEKARLETRVEDLEKQLDKAAKMAKIDQVVPVKASRQR